MARKAQEALDALRTSVASSGLAERLVLEDGSFIFTVKRAQGPIRVSFLLLDIDSYPHTGGIFCLEDANNTPGVLEGLESLAERYFSDKAPLAEVLAKVRAGEGLGPCAF